MDWEQLNAITGSISAICAVCSLAYFNKAKPNNEKLQDTSFLSAHKLIAFLLGWSGWCLACLSFLWFFQPFGSYPTTDEYKQFYAAIIAFPGLVLLRTGILLMDSKPSINVDNN